MKLTTEMLKPERAAGESFKDYKQRRAASHIHVKAHLRGMPIFSGGTYNAGRNKDKARRKLMFA